MEAGVFKPDWDVGQTVFFGDSFGKRNNVLPELCETSTLTVKTSDAQITIIVMMQCRWSRDKPIAAAVVMAMGAKMTWSSKCSEDRHIESPQS